MPQLMVVIFAFFHSMSILMPESGSTQQGRALSCKEQDHNPSCLFLMVLGKSCSFDFYTVALPHLFALKGNKLFLLFPFRCACWSTSWTIRPHHCAAHQQSERQCWGTQQTRSSMPSASCPPSRPWWRPPHPGNRWHFFLMKHTPR